MMPADGWYAMFATGTLENEIRAEADPLIAWAIVEYDDGESALVGVTAVQKIDDAWTGTVIASASPVFLHYTRDPEDPRWHVMAKAWYQSHGGR